MQRYVFLSIVALVVLLSVPSMAVAQEHKGRGKIKGQVTNVAGVALGDSMVTAIYNETGTGPEAVKVKGNGEFEVKDLKPGMWTFTAAAGHMGYGAEIVEAEVLARDTPEITIVVRPAQDLIQQGTVALRARRYAEAREAFDQVLIALPVQAVLLNHPIAQAYEGEGNFPKALEHLDIALEAIQASATPDPAALTALKLQGVDNAAQIPDYARMHAYLSDFSDTEFTPDTAAAIVGITGNTLSNDQKNYEETIKVLDIVLDKAPSNALGYYYRGMAYVQLENDEMAKADLEKCVELSPTENAQVRQAKSVLEQLNPGS